MIRKGYSLYLARSALYGTTFEVTKQTYKQLITWADTTPGVTGYAIDEKSFEYFDGDEPKRATLPLTVAFAGRNDFWDTTEFGSLGNPSQANRVLRAQAELGGHRYELFTHARFAENTIEQKNRQSAQLDLFKAHDLDTTELECKCLMALTTGALSVSQLATKLAVSEIKMMVVALRLWLGQRVVLPMTTEYLQASWMVRRVEHATP